LEKQLLVILKNFMISFRIYNFSDCNRLFHAGFKISLSFKFSSRPKTIVFKNQYFNENKKGSYFWKEKV